MEQAKTEKELTALKKLVYVQLIFSMNEPLFLYLAP